MSSTSRKGTSGSGTDGDWVCSDPKCVNVNFSRRQQCNRCGASKSQTSIKAGGTAIGKQLAEKSKGLFSADDWQCKTCGNVNWARRGDCNLCKAPKFGKVEARTGYGGGYNERLGVEYKHHDTKEDSDGEFDDFGRKKKKFRGKSPDKKDQKDDKKGDDEKEDDKEEEDDDKEEEEDSDEDGDLDAYKLDSDDDEEGNDEDTSKYDFGSDDESPAPKAKSKEKDGGQRSPSRREYSSSSSASSRSSSRSSYSRSRSRSSSREDGSRRQGRTPPEKRGRDSEEDGHFKKRQRSR